MKMSTEKREGRKETVSVRCLCNLNVWCWAVTEWWWLLLMWIWVLTCDSHSIKHVSIPWYWLSNLSNLSANNKVKIIQHYLLKIDHPHNLWHSCSSSYAIKALGCVHQEMGSRKFCSSIICNNKTLEILKYTLVEERMNELWYSHTLKCCIVLETIFSEIWLVFFFPSPKNKQNVILFLMRDFKRS